jgi:O-antigen/teichoic acid export membrane protein
MATPATARPAVQGVLALGAGEVTARLLAFAATVYLSRVLGASFYGMIGVATTVVLYLNRAVDAGMDAGIGVRQVAAHPERLGPITRSMLTFRLMIAVPVVVILGTLSLTILPQPDGAIIALYGLTLLIVGLNGRWILLALGQGRQIAWARVAGEAVMFGLTVALVRGGLGVLLAPIAQFLGDAVAALLILLFLRRVVGKLDVTLDRSVVRSTTSGSPTLVIGSILGLMVFNVDTLFLRVFHSNATVGHYAAAYTLVSFLLNVGITYSYSLLPAFARARENAGETQVLFGDGVLTVYALALPAAIGGSLLAKDIIHLVFGPAYAPAGLALSILIWSIPLMVVRDVGIVALLARGREDMVFRSTLLAAATNIVLNFALIPRWEAAGAALATVLTESVRFTVAFWYARHEGARVPRMRRFLRPSLAALALTVVLLSQSGRPLFVLVPLGVAVYVSVLAALGGLQFQKGARPTLTL